MFQIKDKILDVRDFSFFNKQPIVLRNDIKISQLPDLNLERITSDKDYAGDIFILKNLLFWKDKYGKSLVYDLENNTPVYEYLPNQEIITFRRVDLIANGFLVASKKVNGIKSLFLYDLKKGVFKPFNVKLSLKARSIEDGESILDINKASTELKKYDLEGKEHWSFSVSGKYVDIRGDEKQTIYMGALGLHDGVLWVWLSSGELIGLDEMSGELVKKIGIETTNNEQEFKFGGAMQIDTDTSSLIGLWSKYYIEVNLNDPSLSVKYTDLMESLESASMSISYRSHTFPYDAKSIYFCDDRQGKIGVFDRNKKEVVWSYELDMDRDGIAQILEMKYVDNRWYVLDRNDTLHIFERE